MTSAWWAALSPAAKKAYIANHPNSKYAKAAKRRDTKMSSLNTQLEKQKRRLRKLNLSRSKSSQTASSKRTATAAIRRMKSQLRTLKRG